MHRSKSQNFPKTIGTIIIATFMYCAAGSVAAQTPGTNIPSDGNKLTGDHIRLQTNVTGFIPLDAGSTDISKCAPIGSRIAVSEETTTDIFLRFISITSDSDTLLTQTDKDALNACPISDRVNGYSQYKLPKAKLVQTSYQRSGVTFGALVVPFKYRLGAKELVSSSAIAPYVGFRTAWMQGFGMTFTPILAAGLSLVPVTDAGTSTTTTKSAYTLAAGLRLTSSKSENFSAGLILGRDFLNKVDKVGDKNADKPWVSFYLGYAL